MGTNSKTFADMTETERQTVAEAIWSRERPRCQSALVDTLIQLGVVDGFSYDDLTNLYPDPSDWTATQCRAWLDDNASVSDFPANSNPWDLDRAELTEIWEGELGGAVNDDDTDDELRDGLLDSVDAGDWGDVNDWREAVREAAEPAEVFEWWEVGDWLAEVLEQAGEVVLRNDYGDWWGRCCTGQSVYLDGVIQRIGAEYAAWSLNK